MSAPQSVDLSSRDARRFVTALVLLTALVTWLRFTGIGFQLPVATVNDERVYFEHIAAFESGVPEPAALPRAGFYPYFVSRLAHATWNPTDVEPIDVEGHQAVASALHLHIRTVVAILSLLAIPGMWMIARAFVDRRTAFLATAFTAASPFVQCYAQEGRPHAVVFALILMTLGVALRLGRQPTFLHAAGAAIGAGLAIATLQSAFLLLAPIGVAIVVAPRIGIGRRIAYAVLTAACVALAVRLGYPFLFLDAIDREVQRGHSLLGEAAMGLDLFDGSGFFVLLHGLWTYEAIPIAGLGVGLIALAIRATKSHSSRDSLAVRDETDRRSVGAGTSSGRVRDIARNILAPSTWSPRTRSLVIAGVFFVPYFLAFGAYAQTKPRYALMLVPVLALAAATVLVPGAERKRLLVRWIPAAIVLLAQFATVTRFALVRARPDTSAEAARWIERHMPQAATFHMFRGDDLPLLRIPERRLELAGTFFGSHSPWLQHQSTLGPGPFDAAGRDISTLKARNQQELESELAARDVEHVVWRDLGNPDRPNLRAAREMIARRGTLIATFRPCRDEDPRPFIPREETYDFPIEGFWIGRLWRAERVGRVTEIWQLDRSR